MRDYRCRPTPNMGRLDCRWWPHSSSDAKTVQHFCFWEIVNKIDKVIDPSYRQESIQGANTESGYLYNIFSMTLSTETINTNSERDILYNFISNLVSEDLVIKQQIYINSFSHQPIAHMHETRVHAKPATVMVRWFWNNGVHLDSLMFVFLLYSVPRRISVYF